MGRLTKWAVLVALVLGLIMSVGCQQAEQPVEQAAETTEGGCKMAEEAGDVVEEPGEAGEDVDEEAGETVEEAEEALGTN